MKSIYILLSLFAFIGCTQEHSVKPVTKKVVKKKPEVVSDLINIEQNISAYLPNDYKGSYISTLEKYEKAYFSPWHMKRVNISLEDAMWAYRAFNAKNSYGDNLQPLKESFFNDMKRRSNFAAFSTVNSYAITLQALNIRAFPTDKPLLMNPKKAGEGFPFDYLQNSTIAANKPIFVSHFSLDKEWVFIKASFAYGWVKARDIAFMPKEYCKLYEDAEKEFVVKEGEALYDEKGNFLFRSRIGMLFPEIAEPDKNSILTIANYKINQPYYLKTYPEKSLLHKGILKFNKKNIIAIFNEVSQVNYGWGGIYGERDCSSILRDFYAPFGLWLPRNSSLQSKIGKVISFEGLSNEEKIKLIREDAVPFKTLLYKQGHILLYIGIKNNEIIVFHNTWGIKTKKDGIEGRFIIGKPIFSTLQVGSNLKYYDKNASILTQLKSMNILTQ